MLLRALSFCSPMAWLICARSFKSPTILVSNSSIFLRSSLISIVTFKRPHHPLRGPAQETLPAAGPARLVQTHPDFLSKFLPAVSLLPSAHGLRQQAAARRPPDRSSRKASGILRASADLRSILNRNIQEILWLSRTGTDGRRLLYDRRS